MSVALAEPPEKSSGVLAYLLGGRVLKRNLAIALIVGIVLSLTNQLDVIVSQPFTARLGMKIFLNFLIPFLVASASSWVNRNAR